MSAVLTAADSSSGEPPEPHRPIGLQAARDGGSTRDGEAKLSRMSIDAETDRTPVRVVPPAALRRRPRLFSALERAFPVRFLEGADDASAFSPSFSLFAPDGPKARAHGRSCRIHFATARRPGRPATITFSATVSLPPALRNTTLSEERGVEGLDALDPAGEVLASSGGLAVWISDGSEDWSALAPDELDAGTTLRDRLRDGAFFGLLPLVHWLRGVAPPGWDPPPFRATFVFDDPNLHWRSYGFIRYRELVEHAREYGYAATMATVPRDLWTAHLGTVRLFLESSGLLSLAVHGNDHLKRELQRDLPVEARRALLAEALQRVERFERRWRLPIARVMVPPHGATSRAMALEMPRLGIEAMTDSHPYPWLQAPPPNEVLAGWRYVDVVDGGLPVIPRYHLSQPRADLALRAFLAQPIVLYGHHEDVSSGLEVLAEAAAQVNALGAARWLSLGGIARTNFETRREGSELHVKLANSVIDLDVPHGVATLTVHAHLLGRVNAIVASTSSGETRVSVADAISENLPVSAGPIRLRAVRTDALDHRAVGAERVRVWPLMRRTATETRDRALPALTRLRRPSSDGVSQRGR